jgi:DNA-binding MarR family transcriptional regulator
VSASKTWRDALLEDLARVGREHSDATVLFHGTIAERLGLHPTDYKVLGILERTGAMSAGEIARASGLAPASVTDLIDRLVRKGFVRRVRDQADGRKVLVEPDPERTAAARQLFASARRSLSRLWSRYDDDELAIIADFLARNAERLRQETEHVERQRQPEPAVADTD